MYQLEVKRWLMEHRFPPSEGWSLTVDSMPWRERTEACILLGRRRPRAWQRPLYGQLEPRSWLTRFTGVRTW